MTKSETLAALRSRKSELESNLDSRKRILSVGSDGDGLRQLMNRFIKPRTDDLKDRSWSSQSQQRLEELAAAIEEMDIMKAVKNGMIVDRPECVDASDIHSRLFFHYIDEYREHAGLTEILEWLGSFEQKVEEGDANKILNSLAQLGVCHGEKCDCDEDIDEDVDSYPSLVWMHAHHKEFNRTAWEIVAAKPGMIDALRREIQKDIDGPASKSGRRIFGEIISHAYARKLLAFFVKNRPSPKWVGDLASTAGVSAIAHEDAQAAAS